MTGPEHFAQAERNIEFAAEGDDTGQREMYFLAKAQVHATLALAASQLRSLTAEQAS